MENLTKKWNLKKRYDSSYNANDEVTTFLIQNHMVLKTFHCEKN